MNSPLVSIIIPTFNRAHLIGETLDSIIVQTYTNWECIIVDDGSTDNTEEVVSAYVQKDSRFQFHHRPDSHKPGGNGARNYGFSLSKGEYTNWFDSDDLMLSDKLKVQLDILINSEYDFSVAKHSSFITESPHIKSNVKKFDKNKNDEISLLNYSLGKNYWGTIDLLGHRKIFENQRFNDQLKSGQEYNFFVTVLANKGNIKGCYINKELSCRRIHNNSIQSIQNQNQKVLLANKYEVYHDTFFDNVEKLDEELSQHLLLKMILLYHSQVIISTNDIKTKEFIKSIKLYLSLKQVAVLYLVLTLSKITKRGYSLGKRILKSVF